MSLGSLWRDLKKLADRDRAKILQRFFKTGKGEYGDGDVFLGITVPQSRAIARKHKDLSFNDISKLLQSKIHEERLVALLILVHNFQIGDDTKKQQVFDFYLKNTKYINNWDLVDSSADKILGEYLLERPRDILVRLAYSNNLWERRIAIIATFQFIKKQKEYKWTFKIAEILLKDQHDLIHKATGWMLREVGKNISQEAEEEFLKKHYKQMPRTMLRYAIERFPEKIRKTYLSF